MTRTDLHEFLRSRRSIRRFREEPVPDPVIERILTTATYAPSAHNRQPWRYSVVRSAEMKGCLAEALSATFRRDLAAEGVPEGEIDEQVHRSEKRLLSAPVVILISIDQDAVDTLPISDRSDPEWIMAVQSAAAAATVLLLAAHAEGLGASWICWPLYAPDSIREPLELPETWEPQAMFFIGWPGAEPKPKDVRPLAELARFERG